MNNEIPIPRKPRCDSVLKSFSEEDQDKIGHHAHGRSLLEMQEWLETTYHVKPVLSAISDFLAEFRMIDRRYGNRAAVRGLVTPLDSDGPILSSDELRYASQRHFAETIVNESNISAFNQSERTAVRREELDIRRQELRIQREELELKRRIFERDSCEWVVKTYNHPKIRALAQADDKSYADKVAGMNKIMFGDS